MRGAVCSVDSLAVAHVAQDVSEISWVLSTHICSLYVLEWNVGTYQLSCPLSHVSLLKYVGTHRATDTWSTLP